MTLTFLTSNIRLSWSGISFISLNCVLFQTWDLPFFSIALHIDMIVSHTCCMFFNSITMMWICWSTSPNCSLSGLDFVTWHIITLDVAIRWWAHCDHKRMHMVNNNTVIFKQCSSGTRVTNWASPPARTVNTGQDGATVLCYLCQFLTLQSKCGSRTWGSSYQAKCFQFFVVQIWSAFSNCSLSILFLPDRRGIQRCSSSASRFDVLCMQRWSSV